MTGRRVLVVDDEPGLRQAVAGLFRKIGCTTDVAADGAEGMEKGASGNYDLVVLDLSLPKVNGIDVLRSIKQNSSETSVIMVTAYASIQTAIEAMKLGAYDYLTKPFSLDELQMVADRALERIRLIDENRYLRNELKERYGFDNVIGLNSEIQKAYVMAAQVAQSNATVLVLGETGTGKEFLARTIHYQSQRADGPFIKVNCAALPETLLESELFGHEKGAFTNAVSRRIGRFELADEGTIFLDEIGDVSPATQLKLLRVLQEKQFERVGGSETIRVDVRVIAATNRNLREAIAAREFREDLFYRLNVINIELPPLAERREDIPMLAEHFLRKYCAETGKAIQGFAKRALDTLLRSRWPGNIRELENCVERAVILCNSDEILPEHLLVSTDGVVPLRKPKPSLLRPLRDVEKDHILRILKHYKWNQSQSAVMLGIDRKTLRNKIREFGLTREEAEQGTEESDQ